MGTQGRPAKNGVKEASVFFRAMIALEGYDQARSRGEKYVVSLESGIAAVRREFPDISMSTTEMKRVLAEFRSEGLRDTLFVSESENTVTPDGRKCRKAWALTISAPPKYPRHNAREAGVAKD
jgi:hypothetical protein